MNSIVFVVLFVEMTFLTAPEASTAPKLSIIVFVALFVVVAALAAPEAPLHKVIPVLERTEVTDERGQFALKYRSADGTVFSESGALKPTHDGKDYVLVKEGEYSFISDDGKVYRTKYVADEKGFRAEGEHLPVSVVA